MKAFGLACLLLVALLLAYWAWPFFGLRALAADLQARDAAALSEKVDFVELRRSLTEQIIAAYLRVTGRANKLGALAGLATAVGRSITDPLVAQFVNPDNLVKLLEGEAVPTDVGKVSFTIGQLPGASFGTVWQAWLGTKYGIGRFSLWVPVTAVPADQFRLRMELKHWRWKLTGIDLPAKLREQIAQELAKKFP